MNTEDYKTYLFSYQHEDARWGFEIKAANEQDAKERIAKLAYATLDGELVTRIPCKMAPLAQIVIAAQKAIKALFPTSKAPRERPSPTHWGS